MNNNVIGKPHETGNSEYMEEVCLKNLFALLQYEELADFYTQEPIHIRIKPKETDKHYFNFEQVLRVRIWTPNHSTESWSIYSENREWDNENDNIGGIIIRHVYWDRRVDLRQIENETAICTLNEQWPSISIENVYLKSNDAKELINQIFRNMDLTLEKGINLVKRISPDENSWSNIEIMRMFNWGQVKSTWDSSMVCEELENSILGIGPLMYNNFLQKTTEKVYAMQLDYSCPTHIMKSLVVG